MAGWDLEVSSPFFVPLDIRLRVRAEASEEREGLSTKVLDRLLAGDLPMLRPDYFTFGRSVYLSALIAELMALPEVAEVEPLVFQRWGSPAGGTLGDEFEKGEIQILPLEIAQLDNDPAHPSRGLLEIEIGEGEGG